MRTIITEKITKEDTKVFEKIKTLYFYDNRNPFKILLFKPKKYFLLFRESVIREFWSDKLIDITYQEANEYKLIFFDQESFLNENKYLIVFKEYRFDIFKNKISNSKKEKKEILRNLSLIIYRLCNKDANFYPEKALCGLIENAIKKEKQYNFNFSF